MGRPSEVSDRELLGMLEFCRDQKDQAPLHLVATDYGGWVVGFGSGDAYRLCEARLRGRILGRADLLNTMYQQAMLWYANTRTALLVANERRREAEAKARCQFPWCSEDCWDTGVCQVENLDALNARIAEAEARAEKAERERTEARARARMACQSLIRVLPSSGPENVESAAERAAARVRELEEAGTWVLHVASGIGKSGAPPSDDECRAAFDSLHALLTTDPAEEVGDG